VRVARILVSLWLSWLMMLVCVRLAGADTPPAKRVLLLHQSAVGEPIRARFDAAFVEAVRSSDSVPIDLYEETIKTTRFPGAEQSQLVHDYLMMKYVDRKIDVIVTQGMSPLNFARKNREVFGDPPIVAVASPEERIDSHDENVTGVQGGSFITGTIDLALALRPDTRSMFVVDGTRDDVEDVQPELERQFSEGGRRVNLVYLRDLPLNDLLSRIAAIPEHSVVLFVRQTMRGALQDVDQFEALSQVLRASHVPVFSDVEEFVGRGIVGGYIWRYEADARRVADMVRRIANGARARDIPAGVATYTPLLDWRQLQRWRIADARVPAGSVVMFRSQSFFELYRPYVIGGAMIFVAQLALIVGLLVQRVWRRRAEEESRNNEARYRSVVDTQSDLICRFLADTTLTFVNDAYCRFFNKSREELLGTKFIDFIPPDARATVLERIANIRGGMDSHEHEVTLPDGTIGWHHWINHAILDEQNRRVEFQGVGRDITDRKRAEEALSQAEARNSAMLRAIPDLMFVVLRDGTYVDYHARDPRLLFAPPSAFLGRQVRDVMPPPLVDVFTDALERACRTGRTIVVEYELPFDDEMRSFEARLVHAGNDRVVSIVRDVTETKRVLALNRDLAGRLIASQEAERRRIARDLHDGACQEVAGAAIEVSNLQRRREIRDAGIQSALSMLRTRLGSIAESLRLLSHDLHPSVLQHIGLVPAVESHCVEVERQHDVRVRLKATGDVEPIPASVALSLFRITQEALSNAVKHGRARHVVVTLSRTDVGLTLMVEDDGEGFDVARARREGGLGLVSIEERARLVKGRVVIRSAPTLGTSIEVHVPAEKASPAPPTLPQVHSDDSRVAN